MRFTLSLIITIFITLNPPSALGKNLFIRPAIPGDSVEVNLFMESSFVIRGWISPSWEGTIGMAVTDPVKNFRHDLTASSGNRFKQTVSMKGDMQEMECIINLEKRPPNFVC